MISEGYKQNFETLKSAAKSHRLALSECTNLADGSLVYVVCVVNYEENGDLSFLPVAKLFDGNPYEEVSFPRAPTKDGDA